MWRAETSVRDTSIYLEKSVTIFDLGLCFQMVSFQNSHSYAASKKPGFMNQNHFSISHMVFIVES